MTVFVRWATLTVCALGLAAAATAQYPSLVVGFNGDPNVPGSYDDPNQLAQEMFRDPQHSGSTDGYIELNTSGHNNNYASRWSNYLTEGNAALEVFWRWVNNADPDAWVRLTTFAGTLRPNPALHVRGQVRFKITNVSEFFIGQVGICLGIRETGVDVPQLYDGGATGDIEWVGVDDSVVTLINAGPNGAINSTLGGDDVVVDPDPNSVLDVLVISWGPNRTFQSTVGGDDLSFKGAYAAADGSVHPIPAVILPVTFPDAVPVEFDLSDSAAGNVTITVNGVPTVAGIVAMTGNSVLSAANDRGVLEHIAIVNGVDAAATVLFAIDELQFEAPVPDPVVPPTVKPPIIAGDQFVTVTNLMSTVNRVELFRDGAFALGQDVASPADVVFDLGVNLAEPYEEFTARQRDSVSGLWSDQSAPLVTLPEAAPYSFSIMVDENGNNCDYTDPATGWEAVGVTSIGAGSGFIYPHGVIIFNNSAIWQTIDFPLDDPNVVTGWLGGNGQLDPSPTGLRSIDSIWFVVEPSGWTGPHEAYIDAIQLLDAGDNVLANIHDYETGVNYGLNVRGQSSTALGSSTLSTAVAYDGLYSKRVTWTYADTTDESLGIYNAVGLACNTAPTFPDTGTKIRVHLLARSATDPNIPAAPTVTSPIVAPQTSVRVTNDALAQSVEVLIDGVSAGSLTPSGTTTDFTGLTLPIGASVSAIQTIGGVPGNAALPAVVQAKPIAPIVTAPLAPGSNSVAVTRLLNTTFADADLVEVFVNAISRGSTNPSGTSATVTISGTVITGDLVTARQRVNGTYSDLSAAVTVAFTAPVIFVAPATDSPTVRVQRIATNASQVTVNVGGTPTFFGTPTPGSTFIDISVTGLAAGNVLSAFYTVAGVDSVVSANETVTVATITPKMCDDMESYVDQNDFENAPAEVRDRGWWPASGDPGLNLVTDKNATVGGAKSAYCPPGWSPPAATYADGYQSNFDFKYPEPDWSPLTSTASIPIVWNVTIYDSGGAGADNMYQWCELRDYTTGALGAIIAVGMPGSSFFVGINNNYYSARVYGAPGPGYIDLNDPGAPTRTVGWHTFTTVVKGTLIDFYVDGVLARKNVVRADKPYDNFYMGSGYGNNVVAYPAWYDDFCVHTGKITFRDHVPNAPTVRTAVQDGDTTVTVTDIQVNASLVRVYANGVQIGSANPGGATTFAVPVSPAPQHLQVIKASQVTPTGTSEQSFVGLEVGQGNGDVLVCIGVRETSDAGGLGTPGSGTGAIEWIGAATASGGAPQGVPVGVGAGWTTLTFNPVAGPVLSFSGGNNVIDGTRGVLEHLAITVDSVSPDRSTGVYDVYIDNVVNVGAGPAGADFVITDFEGLTLGDEVLFQEPTYSGTTAGNMLALPSKSEVAAVGNPGQSEHLTWFYKDTTASRWARITTADVTTLPRPIIDLTKSIRFDIRIAPAVNVCLGDTNCNGQVDFADINPFVLALLNHVYCDTTGDNADVSGNGSVGFEDINPFVALLTQNPLPIACP